MSTFVGIDPGLAATGVAVVTGSAMAVTGYSYKVIRTDAGDSTPERLNLIFGELSQTFDQVRPDAVIVEDVFSLARYPKSGISLGQVIGVVMLAACRCGIVVHEIAVREVKQILTGNGNSGKKQLEESVRRRLGHPEPIRPFHASDALSLALVGLYRAGSDVAAQFAGSPKKGIRK
ncbi:MAG: crossover junction endodeoxyribonuclease RuvC [Desulfobacteraceae bacterium]|nr:crossover junction endodeoxyribonuclease RuvC [Desulfobacteraceae bacterium]